MSTAQHRLQYVGFVGEGGGAITEMVMGDGSGVELRMSMIIEDDARGRDVSRGEMGITEENWESQRRIGNHGLQMRGIFEHRVRSMAL